ncbi:MAG: Fe-S cluster assembly protein SufD [Nocardiopsaceae bacterium]|jgi:Fe-S cluster assembly protein SufD|nr:Fe-S cluster assembly protein SufD [Nocardiopsaceae bacterium]
MSGLSGAVETGGPVSRLHAVESFDPADFPVPGGREEEWRFTPLRRLRQLHADVAFNGEIVPEVSAESEIAVVLAQHGDARIGTALVPSDRVSARAFASFDQATIVSVPAGFAASQPVVISVRGSDLTAPAAGHMLVELGPNASAVVVLDYAGEATYADNVEFVVGEGASLSVVSLQDWGPSSVHLSHHGALVGKDASIAHTVVSLGGDVVRLVPSVKFAGPGGDANLRGVYFADAGQHLEHRLLVDHNEPNCRSRVTYKGALQGKEAHTVWIGDVIIRPQAVGTDSYESNRNLVLTDGTRVDSVPNLEILTGEVTRAGHASTSGRLEDQHMFYLMARGIPLTEARRLVIRGFFGELIGQIAVPEVRERITTAIESELEKGI